MAIRLTGWQIGVLTICVLTSGIANAKLHEIALCSEVVAFKGEAYFCGLHKNQGRELFRSSGTSTGTELIIDLDPGPGSSSPSTPFELNGALYFVAETTHFGRSLWRTDGTANGTVRVKALPGSDSTGRVIITKGTAEVFFQITDGVGVSGSLWRTDGTFNGTFQMNSIVASDWFSSLIGIYDTTYHYSAGTLYYTTLNTLYKIDSATNEQKIVKTFETFGFAYLPTSIGGTSNAGDKFYIQHSAGEGEKDQIWISDGSTVGTSLLHSNYQVLAQNGERFLACDTDTSNFYGLNAQSNILLHPVNDDGSVCESTYIRRNIGDRTVFKISFNGPLWTTDFSATGTHPLSSATSNSGLLLKVGNKIVFSNSDGVASGIYQTDGTIAGTELLKSSNGSINTTFDGEQRGYFLMGNNALWTSDGSVAGTRFLKNVGGTEIYGSWHEGQRFYFTVDSLLWHSDGTTAGTYPITYGSIETPLPTPENRVVITPILDLLLND